MTRLEKLYEIVTNKNFGDGFKYIFFYFHPYFGETIQFDEHIFQRGWFNHQLDILSLCYPSEVQQLLAR